MELVTKEKRKIINDMSLDELYAFIKIERYDLYGMSEYLNENEIHEWYIKIHELENFFVEKFCK